MRINKSRYSSIDCYISDYSINKPEYNDIDIPYDNDSYNTLLRNGIIILI